MPTITSKGENTQLTIRETAMVFGTNILDCNITPNPRCL